MDSKRIFGGADSPDVARDVIAATEKEIAEARLGALIGRALIVLTGGFAVLAVIAGFWVLWLAARALFRAMGLG